jgi:hypothetical protein
LAASRAGAVDAGCASAYDEKQCQAWGAMQENKGTLMDSLQEANCDVCLYGKVDVGAGVIEAKGQENATVAGFHGGPNLAITGRTADIRKPTKPDPSNITNDLNNHVHKEDWKKVDQCIEWLENRDSAEVRRGTGGYCGERMLCLRVAQVCACLCVCVCVCVCVCK